MKGSKETFCSCLCVCVYKDLCEGGGRLEDTGGISEMVLLPLSGCVHVQARVCVLP